MHPSPPGYPPPTPPESSPPRTSRRVYVEDGLILGAIAVLWLTVLRLKGPWVVAVQVATLLLMVAIMVVRLRRMLAARRKAEEDARKL